MKKLTIKQKKFADEYIKTGNAYQSALNAGYSESYSKGNVIKLLENVSVKAYIDERMKKLEEEAIADQAEVLKYLTRVLRDEEREEILVNVGNFEQEIQSMKVSTKDKIKAAELLGKRYGSWTDKQEVDINLPTFIDDIQGAD
ncbi:MAG: terminase small subunit [Finegoldia magna]|uniref:terminase small subunit n=1 Tax=Finegoldia magna TaxID=1260 RepID=UPI0029095A0E|nr:terminase small subunit [Finegoldia magna]MDU5272002.1 terminase small subunit [Finegoldia magna]